MQVEFRPARFDRHEVWLEGREIGILSRGRLIKVVDLSEREEYFVVCRIAEREQCDVRDVKVFGGKPPAIPEDS